MKSHHLLSLEGKRALVTGGGTGLGRGIARGLAEAGAEVVVCGRRPGPLEETRATIVGEGGACEIVLADVTVEEDVLSLQAAAGRIDILVNNAAVMPVDAWDTMPIERFRSVVDVNLIAPFRMCQAFAPKMRDHGWGRVINIASVYGSIAGKPHLYPPGWDKSHYVTSKHGIHGITRHLAVRLAPYGVTVNSMSPGGIAGAVGFGMTADEQSRAAFAMTEEERRTEAARTARFLHDEIPMNRMGSQEEYAGAAVFLASPASGYITGQILIVDGGWTIW